MHCIDILTLKNYTNSHTLEPKSIVCNSGIISGGANYAPLQTIIVQLSSGYNL